MSDQEQITDARSISASEAPRPSIISIDPSLTATAIAVSSGSLAGDLHALELITPDTPNGAAWLRGNQMIGWLEDAIAECIADHGVRAAVIEIPSGKVYRKRHGGSGAGLSVYGYLVGRVVEAVRRSNLPMAQITPEQWTGRGLEPSDKSSRIFKTAAIYPAHADQIKANKGGDLADAILLGRQRWLMNAEIVHQLDLHGPTPELGEALQ